MRNTKRKVADHSINPPLIIDAGHYEQLVALAMRSRNHAPELARRLLDEIERARVLPSRDMPADVVTIGSEVEFRDEDTGRVETVRIVLPQDASIDERRVSVLAPIGAALIGLAVGQRIDWEVGGGRIRRITVVCASRAAKSAGPLRH